MEKYLPINPKFPHMIHGGDYNPEQWMDTPEIWDEDMRLLGLAKGNSLTIGIFSWATIEPAEGEYDFTFMDEIMAKLDANGAKAVLATPSGARPAWMSQKYPEVLRTDANGIKQLHGYRHNHCFTSPVYREKTRQINTVLANRYKNHPALLIWHISNEYRGECHCELCKDAFREWLRVKYDNDLGKLNKQWWTAFWSHTYTDWKQIDPPSPRGETFVHGMSLDWKRFITCQTIDFMKNEIAPLKEITPNIPITTNFMGTFTGLDYHKFKDILDVVSWDSYPRWHATEGNEVIAYHTAFVHDINRSIKDGKPFMLMESTPSIVNWSGTNKLKKPNMHILSSLQAVAHGSDTVQYFQWRKGRGCSEKFHGAVVDHSGHENTRVFKEVSALGEILTKLDDVVGTYTKSDVAIIYDWETRWAIDDVRGLKLADKKYEATCKLHYRAFWRQGVNVDVIDLEQSFSKYKLIVAPMLYMMKPGTIEKIKEFVKSGGTFVATYTTGMVDENDLCFLGGFPAGELKDVFGLWAEEIDCLYDGEKNSARIISEELKLNKEYEIIDYCELIHPSSAEVLAEYKHDFYSGMPALTKNQYGSGTAYYIAFRDTGDFTDDFYKGLVSDLKIEKAFDIALPTGVSAHTRECAEYRYVFVENYNDYDVELKILNRVLTDMITMEKVSESIKLTPFGARILKEKK